MDGGALFCTDNQNIYKQFSNGRTVYECRYYEGDSQAPEVDGK